LKKSFQSFSKRIDIAVHNSKKVELIECLRQHRDVFAKHPLYETGTTGSFVEKELQTLVTKLENGPLDSDQQLRAKRIKRELEILIFLLHSSVSRTYEDNVSSTYSFVTSL